MSERWGVTSRRPRNPPSSVGMPPPQPQIVRVIDLETTGNAPPAHGVCEIGWQDVALGSGRALGVAGRGRQPAGEPRPENVADHYRDPPHPRRRRGRRAVVAGCRPAGAQPLAAAGRAGRAPGEFRGAILHPGADPGRGLDLHLEVRAAAVAGLPELFQSGAAVLAQSRRASTTNAGFPPTAPFPMLM